MWEISFQPCRIYPVSWKAGLTPEQVRMMEECCLTATETCDLELLEEKINVLASLGIEP